MNSDGTYYYHEAVNVPAQVTLTDIVFKESANDSTDCYGILLLNSPSAEVILEGTQENLKPVIVGDQSGTTIDSLQNQTFASLTLTDVEESITISGATVELMKNGQAGYIKLNNCSDVTLENCTADALILTNGYLLDKKLAPNEIGKYGQNSGQDVGFLPDSQQQLSVQLDNCVMNTLYLYDNVAEGSAGTVNMAIDSGLYGFDQETVEKLLPPRRTTPMRQLTMRFRRRLQLPLRMMRNPSTLLPQTTRSCWSLSRRQTRSKAIP